MWYIIIFPEKSIEESHPDFMKDSKTSNDNLVANHLLWLLNGK